MGMAASQARLLSITSRMADNELRSQMINNAKMRLTSESAQVSEQYLAALNETQLKFSNYSLTGEQQFQNLSFNSLTAYSSYNNQYGLRNRGGELLVSELDATNFKGAKDIATKTVDGNTSVDNEKALNEFLKFYGIEKATTYFDQLPEDVAEKLRVMYEGGKDADNINHMGYEAAIKSVEYGEYNKLITNYTAAEDSYNAAVKIKMQVKLDDIKKNVSSTNGIDPTNYMSVDENGLTPEKAIKYVKGMMDELINNGYLSKQSDFYDIITANEYYKGTKVGSSYLRIIAEEPGGQVPRVYKNDTDGILGTEITPTAYYVLNEDSTETPDLEFDNIKLKKGNPPEDYTGKIYLKYDGLGDEDGKFRNDDTGNPICYTDCYNDTSKTYVQFDPCTVTEDDYKQGAQTLLNYFNENIYSALDKSKFDNEISAEIRDNLDNAKKDIATFVFGQNITDDVEFGNFDKIIEYCENNEIEFTSGFQTILEIFECENMLNEYGVPKYTYIDVNNPNENADAKAQWYINLFNRMNDGGYKAIESGLASSSDWLKFALESGQVTMEQVNKDQRWVSTTYSNCSCITESAVDIDITVAEAEYNQAMKKIEAKDKRYDMELKNIDTEHQSLQTEYDSIKAAIDKNIERHFKFFSA